MRKIMILGERIEKIEKSAIAYAKNQLGEDISKKQWKLHHEMVREIRHKFVKVDGKSYNSIMNPLPDKAYMPLFIEIHRQIADKYPVLARVCEEQVASKKRQKGM